MSTVVNVESIPDKRRSNILFKSTTVNFGQSPAIFANNMLPIVVSKLLRAKVILNLNFANRHCLGADSIYDPLTNTLQSTEVDAGATSLQDQIHIPEKNHMTKSENHYSNTMLIPITTSSQGDK